MDRKEFIREMDIHLKLVRTEYGYTQEMMASILGLSKKTLVEIEKGRSSLGWMGAVAFSSLFSDSRILSSLLGGEADDMVKALRGQEALFLPYHGRTHLVAHGGGRGKMAHPAEHHIEPLSGAGSPGSADQLRL